MASRDILMRWVLEALRAQGGSASVLQVCKWVWAQHEDDLRSAGDLFYSWQYDIRWAATKLRKQGRLAASSTDDRGVWRLAGVEAKSPDTTED